jgi:hypothetical protein
VIRFRSNPGHFKFGKGSRPLILGAIAAVVLVAAAVAYWMATGSGSATARLGSPEQLTLSTGVTQGTLAPGDDSGVAVIATNSNPYFVTIASLGLDATEGTGGFDVDAGHSGCDLAALHFTPVPAPIGIFGQGWRVPPKVGSDDGTLPFQLDDALSMDAEASNACQGAAFTIHLVAGS